MKQASLSGGKVSIEHVPVPEAAEGQVLIAVECSCVSVGTELAAVKSSGEGILAKIKKKPKVVGKALQTVREGGVTALLKKIEASTGGAVPLGYSVSGTVIDTGRGVTRFAVGDVVAAAGAGYANHAEVVSVPENLVVFKPVNVSFADASTVALGAIALHGVRRCSLQLGEVCVVVGAGMLGMLALQILRASGVRVIAVDPSSTRRAVAKALGAELVVDPVDAPRAVLDLSSGRGADVVLFAAATGDSGPLRSSFSLCKRRGKVVMLGVSGMDLKREDLYPNELDLHMATSYGPGRYDATYEEMGRDYPFAYVRWTENRNMSEYLRLLACGGVSLTPLRPVTYPVDRLTDAFAELDLPEKPFTIILEYGKNDLTAAGRRNRAIQMQPSIKVSSAERLRIAVIGLGSFSRTVHLPHIVAARDQWELAAVLDHDAHRALVNAREFGAAIATTSIDELIAMRGLDAVIIATRHDSHARLTLRSLEAGLHTFVEKPLGINNAELESVEAFFNSSEGRPGPLLMVGFNRRFSPLVLEMKSRLSHRTGPSVIHYRMNAGFLAHDHWLHNDGGRIIGEACHAIDLLAHLTDADLVDVTHRTISPGKSRFRTDDNVAAILKYSDGSIATLEYFSMGSRDCTKEHVEVHFDGCSLVLDDFRALHAFGAMKKETVVTPAQEKGHKEELQAFYQAIKNPSQDWPISLDSILETSRTAIRLASSSKDMRNAG